jgi:hypothetical protein
MVSTEVNHDPGMLLIPDVRPEVGSAELPALRILHVDRRIVQMNHAGAKQLLLHLLIKGSQQSGGLGQPIASRGAGDLPAASLADPLEAVEGEVIHKLARRQLGQQLGPVSHLNGLWWLAGQQTFFSLRPGPLSASCTLRAYFFWMCRIRYRREGSHSTCSVSSWPMQTKFSAPPMAAFSGRSGHG